MQKSSFVLKELWQSHKKYYVIATMSVVVICRIIFLCALLIRGEHHSYRRCCFCLPCYPCFFWWFFYWN